MKLLLVATALLIVAESRVTKPCNKRGGGARFERSLGVSEDNAEFQDQEVEIAFGSHRRRGRRSVAEDNAEFQDQELEVAIVNPVPRPPKQGKRSVAEDNAEFQDQELEFAIVNPVPRPPGPPKRGKRSAAEDNAEFQGVAEDNAEFQDQELEVAIVNPVPRPPGPPKRRKRSVAEDNAEFQEEDAEVGMDYPRIKGRGRRTPPQAAGTGDAAEPIKDCTVDFETFPTGKEFDCEMLASAKGRPYCTCIDNGDGTWTLESYFESRKDDNGGGGGSKDEKKATTKGEGGPSSAEKEDEQLRKLLQSLS